MEHAVEALKLAVAVIVFVLAVSLTYMLFSKTKSTADSIFYIRDSQRYMEEDNLENIVYITSSGVNTNRIVGMETIITTLYRYHKENFGVTIVVKNGTGYKIYSRYDNTTESLVNNWYGEDDNQSINDHIDYLNNYVTIKENDGTDKYTWDGEVLKRIYKIKIEGTTTETIETPWLGNEVAIADRISADVSGKGLKFGDTKLYNSDDTDDSFKNLMSLNCNFKEYIKVIDNNLYVQDVAGGNTEFINEKNISKTEIIYIQE